MIHRAVKIIANSIGNFDSMAMCHGCFMESGPDTKSQTEMLTVLSIGSKLLLFMIYCFTLIINDQ